MRTSAAFHSCRCALINKMVLKGFPMYLHELGIRSTPEVPARFLGIFFCVLSLAQQVCSNSSHEWKYRNKYRKMFPELQVKWKLQEDDLETKAGESKNWGKTWFWSTITMKGDRVISRMFLRVKPYFASIDMSQNGNDPLSYILHWQISSKSSILIISPQSRRTKRKTKEKQ